MGPCSPYPAPNLVPPLACPQPSAGAFPRVLASEHWGFATPEPQCQTHPTASPPPRHIGAPPIIQGVRTGRAHRAQGDIQRSHVINPLGPSSPTQRLHLRPAPPLAAQPLAWACLTLCQPRGALPKGPCAAMLRMGMPKLQCQIHPAARLPREPIGAPPLIQGGRRGRALQPPAKFEGPLHQNPWAHAPPSQRSQLGLLFRSPSLSARACPPPGR